MHFTTGGSIGIQKSPPLLATGPKALPPMCRLPSTREDESLSFMAPLNRYANVDIRELQGQVLYLCKDQYGSRYLQKQIEDLKQDAIKIIFSEVYDHFVELMTGNVGAK
jgi:hypothetical protein